MAQSFVLLRFSPIFLLFFPTPFPSVFLGDFGGLVLVGGIVDFGIFLVYFNPFLVTVNQNFKKFVYNYDLQSGKVNEMIYQPKQSNQLIHQYHYDADNRVTRVFTSTDGIHFSQDAKYFYLPHGPLARTEIGDLKVQATDFMYTLQGWLKGVNSTILSPDKDMGFDGFNHPLSPNRFIPADQYSYGLDYFTNDYKTINTGVSGVLASVTNSTYFNANRDLFNGNIKNMFTSIAWFKDKIGGFSTGKSYQYDQLNRLTEAKTFYSLDRASNQWLASASESQFYKTSYQYDQNGNIRKLNRNAYIASGMTNPEMDNFDYSYNSNTNQLASVNDIAPNTSTLGDDIEGMHVYGYYANGNLMEDLNSDIDLIKWTPSGKIKEIFKTDDTKLEFVYDASGNRIAKIFYPPGFGTPGLNIQPTIDIYSRDAQGNTMANYKLGQGEGSEYYSSYTVNEYPIYGSSRLGVYNRNKLLAYVQTTSGAAPAPPSIDENDTKLHIIGKKKYELNNHLGNVLETVTDRRFPLAEATGDNFDLTEQHGWVVNPGDGSTQMLHQDGKLKAISNGAWAGLKRYAIPTVSGKKYKINHKLWQANNNSLHTMVYDNATGKKLATQINLSQNDHPVVFQAIGSSVDVVLAYPGGSGNYTFTVDDFELSEITASTDLPLMTFASSVEGWQTQTNASASVSSGKLNLTLTQNAVDALYQTFTTETGKEYFMKFDLTINSGNYIEAEVIDGSSNTRIVYYFYDTQFDNSSRLVSFKAQSNSTKIRFYMPSWNSITAPFSYQLDNMLFGEIDAASALLQQNFDTPGMQNWTAINGANLAAYNNKIDVAFSTQWGGAYRNFPTTPGKEYVVNVDIDEQSPYQVHAYIYDANGVVLNRYVNYNVAQTYMFKATTSTTRFELSSSKTSDVFSFDNFKVTEINAPVNAPISTFSTTSTDGWTAAGSSTVSVDGTTNKLKVILNSKASSSTNVHKIFITEAGKSYVLEYKMNQSIEWLTGRVDNNLNGERLGVFYTNLSNTNPIKRISFKAVSNETKVMFFCSSWIPDNMPQTIYIDDVSRTEIEGGVIQGYVAEVVSAQEYYPFGSIMPGRSESTGEYRFGYGGHEKLDEVSGSGNTVDMGDRWLDVRLGRTTKIDAHANKYPSLSPYSYAANNPLIFIDPDGKDIILVHGTWSNPKQAWKDLTGISQASHNLFQDNKLRSSFQWSGGNYAKSRTKAAIQLIDHIRTQMQSEDFNGEITLVGHSHGGNVSIEALNMMTEMKEFDNVQFNLLTINTPSRQDYQLSKKALDRVNHVNVYDPKDPVQSNAGNSTVVLPDLPSTPDFMDVNTKGTGEYGSAGRTFKNAKNIEVNNPQGVINGWELDGGIKWGDFHNSQNRVNDWIDKTKNE